jgi:hypothetical protein
VFLRVPYLRSGRSVLGPRLVLRCSENNVRKLKIRYKFTLFVGAKIRKSRDSCIVKMKMHRLLLNLRTCHNGVNLREAFNRLDTFIIFTSGVTERTKVPLPKLPAPVKCVCVCVCLP